MVQMIEAQRDLVTTARDTYVSVTSNRLNQIMKVLTIITTLFMPLTFMTGVYGMNFLQMPLLHHPLGFPLTMAAMASVTVGMILFFRRKRWI